MCDFSNIINLLPRMLSGKELTEALKIVPKYDPEICTETVPMRLTALSDLYRIYIPSQMSVEIYSKLYLALLRSIQKKGTKLAIRQQNQNHRAILQQEYSGIIGGLLRLQILTAKSLPVSLYNAPLIPR